MAIPSHVRAWLDEQNLTYRKERANVLAITVAGVPASIETTLEYQPRVDVLTWRAVLLKGKKKRKAFIARLRDPDTASAFHALGLDLYFGELRADPMLGPLVQVRWPLCAVNKYSLLRAEALMRDTPALSRCVAAALDGDPIALPLSARMAFLHRRTDFVPATPGRAAPSDGERAQRAARQRERQRDYDPQRLEIHAALKQGNLKTARELAAAIATAIPTSI